MGVDTGAAQGLQRLMAGLDRDKHRPPIALTSLAIAFVVEAYLAVSSMQPQCSPSGLSASCRRWQVTLVELSKPAGTDLARHVSTLS